MKKFLLPIFFTFFLSFVQYSYAQDYQTSKNCLEEWHNAQYQCDKVHKKCVEGCSGQYIDKCIGVCFDEQYECYDAVKAEYDKCLNNQQNNPQTSNRPSETSTPPQSPQPQTEQPTELEKSPQQSGPLPVFVGEWFNFVSGLLHADDAIVIIWTGGRTLDELAKTERQISFIESLDEDFVWERTGAYTDDIIGKIEHEPNLAKDFIAKLKDDPKFEPPQILQERKQQAIENARADQTKNYEFLKDVEIDENGKPVLIQMPQGTMRLSPANKQKAILKYKDNTPTLESGQLEVLEETKGENPTKIETPTAEIFVIGTNFLVSVNGKSKDSTILVYEGQVEVRTKDGKKATVFPEESRPGVVFISRESSPVKLALIGLVLIAVLGGVILVIRKKLMLQRSAKRKRN